jgi:hypothetical protein
MREPRPARACQPGDRVTTDYSGRVTTHTILARCDDRSRGHSQSGILFQLSPPVPKSGGAGAWIDADWFAPARP